MTFSLPQNSWTRKSINSNCKEVPLGRETHYSAILVKKSKICNALIGKLLPNLYKRVNHKIH